MGEESVRRGPVWKTSGGEWSTCGISRQRRGSVTAGSLNGPGEAPGRQIRTGWFDADAAAEHWAGIQGAERFPW